MCPAISRRAGSQSKHETPHVKHAKRFRCGRNGMSNMKRRFPAGKAAQKSAKKDEKPLDIRSSIVLALQARAQAL